MQEAELNTYGRTKKSSKAGMVPLVFDNAKVKKAPEDDEDEDYDTFYDCYYLWERGLRERQNYTRTMNITGSLVPVNFTKEAQEDFLIVKKYTDVFQFGDTLERNYNCSGVCTREPLFFMSRYPSLGRPPKMCDKESEVAIKGDLKNIQKSLQITCIIMLVTLVATIPLFFSFKAPRINIS